MCEDSKVVLEIKDGPVIGYIDKTDEGTYYKFKSIPYAAPPIGCLRFLPPSPVKPWTTELDCTQDAPLPLHCSMKCKNEAEIVGSEDCLYIEISTPNIKPDKLMPVMFWIGTYGFFYNLDFIYDPTLINDQEVVYVRCGFRLGPLGFLSMKDYTAPGNCGLKDIVSALKWIQTNIRIFGGDPNNITLFGNSTGGAIVHFMILSPLASGLFHKAIIQSTSALNTWTLDKNPTQSAIELAKRLGITKSCKVELMEELRLIPANDLVQAAALLQWSVEFGERDMFSPIFKPCVEEEFEGQPAFLTKTPLSVIKSGNFNKVPLIIGSNNIEGAVLQFIKTDFYDNFEKFNKDVSLLVPKSLAGEAKLAKSIGHQLVKFYLGGEESLTEDTKSQYLQLISDYYFLYYVNKTVRVHSQFGPEKPIYYYIVNYAGDWCVPDELKFLNSLGHAAEISFIFRIKLPCEPVCKGSRDSVATRSRVVKLWTNFAKYGNPTPEEEDPLLQIKWDPVKDENTLNYLSIGSELTKGRNPFYERMVFWDKLHDENTLLRALAYFHDLGLSW